MARDSTVSRRTMMKVTGAAAATALVAGCTGNGDDDDDGNGDGNGDDNGNGGDEPLDPDEQILLEGETGGWVGVEPESIEGDTNPTLDLQDGETYEIGWIQGDGSAHNIVLWDEDDEVVNDYYLYDDESDTANDPDDDGDFLEFEASDEIVTYRCFPHGQMEGDINVE